MSIGNIMYSQVKVTQLKEHFLDTFDRYQEVTKVWRTEDDKKVIRDISYNEIWGNEKKNIVINELKDLIISGGHLFVAKDNGKLAGFAAVGGDFLDENNIYIQLVQMQVSRDYRRYGIGRNLFMMCVDQVSKQGAKKMYISGHSSVETQAFYTMMGCVDAVWISPELFEDEPYDCHQEYIL